ncbi:abortive infection family protein [Acaryochloris sp. 'Moss Beach']|uniref:abortive infection family protein n=1 Tax=Acaryochloris sp. 'Moss Beach' TaxID=2740837 RepID=UPI001F279681|nr:abortive infection family protein [Acaryochloris sp. 'Moss Beach']UJB70367.1 abortive infection family protein [Acaryochloris sp. 'Moss Beach']
MELSQHSIKALSKIVTGDEELSPYRSGPKLVDLFNKYGFNDTYGQDFPSRWMYTEECLLALNGTDNLAAVICHILDPREFMDTKKELKPAIEFVNKRLKYDGYQVTINRGTVKIRNVEGSAVQFSSPYGSSTNDAHAFIDEQIEKSEQKVLAGDYDGAITNARSLLEAIMLDIESTLDSDVPEKYDGDMVKLYKRVQKILYLEPSRKDIDSTLKQVLSGLVNIISGIAASRNRMSDAHVRSYKPSKHHAVLVVNSAKTLANFLYDTKEYQSLKAK